MAEASLLAAVGGVPTFAGGGAFEGVEPVAAQALSADAAAKPTKCCLIWRARAWPPLITRRS